MRIARTQNLAKIKRPILRGRDIKRYSYNFADLWLINTHNGIKERDLTPINIDDYAAVKRHLKKFQVELEARTDKGDTPYNLRNCAYMDDFNKQKLIWIELSDIGRFALDANDNYLTLNGTFIMVGSDLKYICSVLNNPVTSWHFNTFCIGSGVGTNQWRELYVKELFIPGIAAEQKNAVIDLFDKITSFKDLTVRNSKMKELDHIIYSFFEFNKDEIAFIESQ